MSPATYTIRQKHCLMLHYEPTVHTEKWVAANHINTKYIYKVMKVCGSVK